MFFCLFQLDSEHTITGPLVYFVLVLIFALLCVPEVSLSCTDAVIVLASKVCFAPRVFSHLLSMLCPTTESFGNWWRLYLLPCPWPLHRDPHLLLHNILWSILGFHGYFPYRKISHP